MAQASDTAGDATGAAFARRLRNSLLALGLLVVAIAALLNSLPGLSEIDRLVTHASSGWLALAVGLEYLSCTGYVLTVLLAFPRGRARPTVRLAWSELAANAVLPAGGLGGLGLGAWILTRRGVPSSRIAVRSTVVFLLTSAASIAALVIVGVGLWLGIFDGTRRFTLTLLPAAVGVAAVLGTIGGAAWAEHAAESTRHRRTARAFGSLAAGIRATLSELAHPDWKLSGAIAYFAFDVATLGATFAAIGHTPPLATMVMAYLIGQLAGLIPIPGGLGAVEGGLVGALTVYGVKLSHATAAVLLYRAISLLLPAILGTIAFLILRRDLDKPLVLRPQNTTVDAVASDDP